MENIMMNIANLFLEAYRVLVINLTGADIAVPEGVIVMALDGPVNIGDLTLGHHSVLSVIGGAIDVGTFNNNGGQLLTPENVHVIGAHPMANILGNAFNNDAE